jgi:hypothetical protein
MAAFALCSTQNQENMRNQQDGTGREKDPSHRPRRQEFGGWRAPGPGAAVTCREMPTAASSRWVGEDVRYGGYGPAGHRAVAGRGCSLQVPPSLTLCPRPRRGRAVVAGGICAPLHGPVRPAGGVRTQDLRREP